MTCWIVRTSSNRWDSIFPLWASELFGLALSQCILFYEILWHHVCVFLIFFLWNCGCEGAVHLLQFLFQTWQECDKNSQNSLNKHLGDGTWSPTQHQELLKVCVLLLMNTIGEWSRTFCLWYSLIVTFVGLSYERYQRISSDEFNMRRFVAKFEARLPTVNLKPYWQSAWNFRSKSKMTQTYFSRF